MIVVLSIISLLITGFGLALWITAKWDETIKAVVGFGVFVMGTILCCTVSSQNQDDDSERAVKEYIENPSSYQVDSILVNGVFDHIEVKKL